MNKTYVCRWTWPFWWSRKPRQCLPDLGQVPGRPRCCPQWPSPCWSHSLVPTQHINTPQVEVLFTAHWMTFGVVRFAHIQRSGSTPSTFGASRVRLPSQQGFYWSVPRYSLRCPSRLNPSEAIGGKLGGAVNDVAHLVDKSLELQQLYRSQVKAPGSRASLRLLQPESNAPWGAAKQSGAGKLGWQGRRYQPEFHQNQSSRLEPWPLPPRRAPRWFLNCGTGRRCVVQGTCRFSGRRCGDHRCGHLRGGRVCGSFGHSAWQPSLLPRFVVASDAA